tara:strand:+ start:302 stop:460 length:159 start_codon:yes stop_codon:yes gene_type:complete
MNWLKNRLKERTSLDGVILVIAGGSVILLGPLAKIAAWAMVAYGAWTIWKSE